MEPYDIWQHAVDGATRSDARNLDPRFVAMLQQFYGAAPEELRNDLMIMSAYRSPERQRELWEASDKSGKMVAPPGRSYHNKGLAIDFRYGSDAARQWAHENADDYGMVYPMSYENWHIEPSWARSGGGPAMDGAAAGLDYPPRTGAGLSMGTPVAEEGLNEPTVGDRMDRASRLFEIAATLLA